MKIEIIEKAWCVNADKFEEPWFHNSIVYYGTRGQARTQALPDNDAGTLVSGKDLDYLTIPVIRSQMNDKIKYKGEIIRRYEIQEKDRYFKIKELPKDKLYYVQDNRNYVGNAVLWWGLNGNGYVTDLEKAQKYTWEKIQKFNPRETDIIWESEHVESAVRQYVDMQGLNRENSL